ncbi:MAG: hypothetical protein RR575_00045 [Acinetobacter sp.]
MELIHLFTYQSLIAEISDELATFAAFLDIPTNIDREDDHIYIKDFNSAVSLNTFDNRRNSDVMVSPEVFCEILIDIKSGMSIREAYNKQGYTFN